MNKEAFLYYTTSYLSNDNLVHQKMWRKKTQKASRRKICLWFYIKDSFKTTTYFFPPKEVSTESSLQLWNGFLDLEAERRSCLTSTRNHGFSAKRGFPTQKSMSLGERTNFLDTPFPSDLQTNFCWCHKSLRFRYPQSFQSLGSDIQGSLFLKWFWIPAFWSGNGWVSILGFVSWWFFADCPILHHHF